MAYYPGEQLHGFTVDRVRYAAEQKGNVVEMHHNQTGAELVWLDNGETNKTFCIAFKTLPEDSTGVFHILEHSVLCGSEKFPVREPFVELLKGSLNTFLNAMTFSDKTIYPVSSRDDQDFMNLTEVYLDAVFAPRITTFPNIFYQEGWHIELNDPQGTPSYKGVVFNEMKGAMSSVDEVAGQTMLEMVYPDNCYGFNSGGDPRVIPQLTYGQFVNMYRRYYHPSNSRTYLDGQVPLDRVLTLMDEYLSRFERLDEKHDIVPQQPKGSERTVYYEVGPEEDMKGKELLCLGKLIGMWDDQLKAYAADALCDVLTGNNESPLKRALLSAGLAQDVSMYAMTDIQQPMVMLTIRNLGEGGAAAAMAQVKATCQELVSCGLDQAALEATINRMEFQTLETHEPAGVYRGISVLKPWLHGGDPMEELDHSVLFARLREMAENGGFEQLLQELLLDETGLCVLHLLPSKTLGEELRRDEAERLSKLQAAWTEADVQELLRLNQELVEWQQTPDTLAQLEKLPMLELKDISPEPQYTKTTETQVNGVTVLQHEAHCGGIVHLELDISLTDFTLPELTRLTLLTRLLGALPTAEHDAASLQQAVKTHLGRLNFSMSAPRERLGHPESCKPVLQVICSVLENKLNTAEELLHEILTTTRLDETERIREIAMQVAEQAKQYAVMSGHVLSFVGAASHFSSAGAVSEAVNGNTANLWQTSLATSFDAELPELLSLYGRVLGESVCTARMQVGVTAAEPVDVSALLDRFPVGTATVAEAPYVSTVPWKAGRLIPAQIGYSGMANQLSHLKVPFDGSFKVAAQIISLSYLWNQVRVQGGAYGAGMMVDDDGSMLCYSYRDPSPAKTLETYRGIASFLREFIKSGEPLDKFVIGAISGTEPLMSPLNQGIRATANWYSGRTLESARQLRAEMLHTTPEKLLAWCDVLERACAEAPVCVVADEASLKNCEAEKLTLLD